LIKNSQPIVKKCHTGFTLYSKTTSSEAILATFPNMAFNERWNERVAWSR